MSELFSKRQILVSGGSLGFLALASRSSNPQEPQGLTLDFAPGEVGEIHSKNVYGASGSILEANPLSEDSLTAALSELTPDELVTKSEADVLVSMIRAVLRGETLDTIVNEVEKLYSELVDTLRDVAKAIAEIIRDSVRIAREILGSEEVKVIIRAIAHDIRGAIDGAVSGAGLGSKIPKFGAIAGAIFGAIIGASSASTIGVYEGQQE